MLISWKFKMKNNLQLLLNVHYSHEIVLWLHILIYLLLFPIIILVSIKRNLYLFQQHLYNQLKSNNHQPSPMKITCLLSVLRRQIVRLYLTMKMTTTTIRMSQFLPNEKLNLLRQPHGKLQFHFLNLHQC